MRATYSASICGMHHMSLRHGLRWFWASRRRTVSRDTLSCAVNLTISPASSSSVQRARPAGGFEHAVATSRASSLPGELALCSGARLFAQRSLQVAFDKAPLGPVDHRAADPDACGDLFIVDAGVRSQQDLGSLELARRVLAAAHKLHEFCALALAQFDPIAYIHPCLLVLRHGSPAESDGRRGSLGKNLHRQAGPISGL